MSLRVLAVGDLVGKPGQEVLRELLPKLKEQHRLDFIVVNAENAASNGSGVTAREAQKILAQGVDVITLGDHWFKKSDLMPLFASRPEILRPLNYCSGAAGQGYGSFACGPHQIGVINLQGRVFMEPTDCPFAAAERALEALAQCQVILVDFHAEATSESIAMGWYLDGRVTAVWGTHTHVQTADERVLPKGTAFITDLGMTGPHNGIIGRQVEPVLKKMTTSMPAAFHVATDDLKLMGILLEVDPQTGKALSIERLQVPYTR